MKVLQFLLLLLLVPGCAGMVTDKRDVVVRVFSEPPGALVEVNANSYLTPASILVPRGEGEFTLTISKPGFRTETVPLQETEETWIGWNVLNLCVGCVVDFLNGSGYSLTPTKVEVTLQKQ